MQGKAKRIMSGIWSFLKPFLVTVATMLLITRFVRPSRVNGTSMWPTYRDGQYVVILCTKDVDRGDVAVLWSDELDRYVIKRVVGVSGDVLQVDGRGLVRNGELIYEGYVADRSWPAYTEEASLVVGHDELFVMGDNRTDSRDSRELGTFRTDDVVGRVILG